ncbi:MAG: hypothetical protein IH859_10575, partial [Chloroflexi bacterium]|nr:hypothetical protein [Chloroflexota bacterium]
ADANFVAQDRSDIPLLIRAVRQLGERLDEVEDVAQLDSEEEERIEAERPIDPDILELIK